MAREGLPIDHLQGSTQEPKSSPKSVPNPIVTQKTAKAQLSGGQGAQPGPNLAIQGGCMGSPGVPEDPPRRPENSETGISLQTKCG